jgi:hypothetical protein
MPTFKNSPQHCKHIAWDKESGYFGYMEHDESGNAKEFFVTPKVEPTSTWGLMVPTPFSRAFARLNKKKSCSIKYSRTSTCGHPPEFAWWTKQAPYYRIDGYWNGAVWMPHQWFMWKTMLDLGRTDLAWKIAERALDVWKKETDETYFTYEHWFAKTARGAGWHQFGALSAPVLNWYSAYYKPGTVTAGFEVWIDSQSFNADHSKYEATLSFDEATKAHKRSLLVVMNPEFQYEILINGKKAEAKSRYNGQLEIELPASNKPCKLEIHP